jgi:hypothetical protein
MRPRKPCRSNCGRLGGLGRLWVSEGLLGGSWSPLPPPPALEERGAFLCQPHCRYLTQLKNLILAVGFSVKVAKRALPQRDLLALRRPLGDISARGAGGIHYWEPLGAVLGQSWSLLGRAWGSPEALRDIDRGAARPFRDPPPPQSY